MHNLALAGLAFVFSLAVLIAGGHLMNRATNHSIVASALQGAGLKALNVRFAHYGTEDAAKVWSVISKTDGGLKAERAFLKLDLFFPVLYGGALAFSLLAVLFALGASPQGVWFLTPVAVAVLADWTENSIHLRQLKTFDGTAASLDAGLIQLASVATGIKLVFVILSLLLIPLLPLLLRRA
ncbi:hypothetical protein [Hoeflea sp. TYP-13]|uniref:hypothetical protein n=1 Tax=Hoeflea sp. TYP-13 TaxID=3230023 RepID=UPI0034C62F33